MNDQNEKIYRVFNCFKFFLYKNLVEPLNVIFSLFFPIAWMIVAFFIFSYNKEPVVYGDVGITCKVITFSASGSLFLSIISIALITLPYNLALDRIHKRLKIYRVFDLTKNAYIFVNLLVTFVVYFTVFIIQMLILNFGFGIYLRAKIFFLTILINVLSFLITSLLGVFISTLSKNDKTSYVTIALFFYPVLFLSGVSIPAFLYDPHQIALNSQFKWTGIDCSTNYSWFKFIQFLSPIGTGIFFVQNIIIWDKTSVNLFSWDVDWIGIFLQTSIAVACYFFGVKRFRWK